MLASWRCRPGLNDGLVADAIQVLHSNNVDEVTMLQYIAYADLEWPQGIKKALLGGFLKMALAVC